MENSKLSEGFDLKQHLKITGAVGRNYVSKRQNQIISDLYSPLNFDPLNSHIPAEWNFWERFLWCENYRNFEPRHNYSAYAFSPLYDYYFSLYNTQSYWVASEHSKALSDGLMQDWLEYEKAALQEDKLNQYTKTGFQREYVENRISKLERQCLHRNAEIHSLKQLFNDVDSVDESFALFERVPLLGVVELSGLPCSKYHDEYMFLRMVQVSECYFFILGRGLEDALNSYKEGHRKIASDILKSLNLHMSELIELFGLMDTMPVESFFYGFRDDTGNAGAIQSGKYQFVESLLTGIHDLKLEKLRGISELQDKHKVMSPCVTTLKQTYITMLDNEAKHEVSYFSNRLLKQFQYWKAKHIAIAMRMLPKSFDDGKGVKYLKQNLKNHMDTFKTVKTHDKQVLISEAFQSRYGTINCSFIALRKVKLDILRSNLDGCHVQLKNHLKQNAKAINQTITSYQALFDERAAFFPLQSQFERGLPGKKASLAPRLLLSVELHRGVLAGVFDLSKIEGALLLDVTTQGEKYICFNGKDVVCGENDIVVRDEKGILASYFLGPGKRSMWSENTDLDESNLCIVLFGSPDMNGKELEYTSEFICNIFEGAATVEKLPIQIMA